MHRNTFINSPKLLFPSLQTRFRSDLFFAGQITGVEGYLGNIATGLLSGLNASLFVEGKDLIVLPVSTIIGALCSYVSSSDPDRFQPMKANFGILPPLEDGVRRNRRQRARAYADRSSQKLSDYLERNPY
jgi:methylenetetrahydrofolate--tRNA-(uracil-5-)-methyltransferase